MSLATTVVGSDYDINNFGVAELPATWFGGAGAGEVFKEAAVLRLGECVYVEDKTLTGNTTLCAAWPNKSTRVRENAVCRINRAVVARGDSSQNPWSVPTNVTVTPLSKAGKKLATCTSITLESTHQSNTPKQNALAQTIGRFQIGQTFSITAMGLFIEKKSHITTSELGSFQVTNVLPSGSDVYQIGQKTIFHINLKQPTKSQFSPKECPFPGLSVPWEILTALVKAENPYPLIVHGASGVGKTSLVTTFAKMHDIPLEIVVCNHKAAVDDLAEKGDLKGIVLLEGVDSKLNTSSIKRIAANARSSNAILVSTATSINKIPSSLRKGDVLGLEVMITPPDEVVRGQIFQYYLPSSTPADCHEAATQTRGCTGKDISRICELWSPTGPSLNELCLSHKSELHRVVCTEVLSPVSFDEIGGLEKVKQTVRQAVMWPAQNEELASKFNVTPASGMLLFGPPGCAKTTVVRAIAHESGRPLFSVDAAGLFACYVGESEEILRSAFAKAALVAPSMLFIDEIESICGSKRSDSTDDTASKLLTTLLTELDGVTTRADILFMAATNYPEALDPAVLRPGRLDMLLHVPPPTASERFSILKLHTASVALAPDSDAFLELLSSDQFTANYTGADLKSVVTEAKLTAVRRILQNVGDECLTADDFNMALEVVLPSLDSNIIERYYDFEKQMG
eukprot:TRINITY_DN15080_c0_g2_i1.p1 TRINITY_DN15080_c0_g2~~TRINITY_DN15080_c0_g2_i1.p1  ORF type:complete len:684 (+),score=120.19 TRINITY_DN15080_c0_g2_i1:53-2104(+)